MKNALIGYTGFVGSNLDKHRNFNHRYNSKNFRGMRGKTYDEVVCAGISAVKWQANKEPEKDRAAIQDLQDVLSTIQAGRFVLISTIDVYPVSQGKDETFDCRSMNNHAYGRHRLDFEDFCTHQFSECHVIRLPGLFGAGLKKNIIYDLLNDNCLDMINAASSFQYYDLENLWSDIERVVQSDIRLINIFTGPISTSAIIDKFFPGTTVGENAMPEAHYDLRTYHSSLWNKEGGYAYSSEEVMQQLERFIQANRSGSNAP